MRLRKDVKLPASKSSALAGGSGRYVLIEAGEEGTLRCDATRAFSVQLDDATMVPLGNALCRLADQVDVVQRAESKPAPSQKNEHGR